MEFPILHDAIVAIGGVRKALEGVSDPHKRMWLNAAVESFERTVEQVITDRAAVIAGGCKDPDGLIKEALDRIVGIEGECLLVKERGKISTRTNLEIRSTAEFATRLESTIHAIRDIKEFEEICKNPYRQRADSGDALKN